MRHVEKLRLILDAQSRLFGDRKLFQSEILNRLKQVENPEDRRRINGNLMTDAMNGDHGASELVDMLLQRPMPGRQGRPVYKDVENYLKRSASNPRLTFNGIFDIESEAEFRRAIGLPTASAGDGVVFDRGAGPDLKLTKCEAEARDILKTSLMTPMGARVRMCCVPPTIGASVPAVALAALQDGPWDRIALLRPNWNGDWNQKVRKGAECAALFDSGLQSIAEQLDAAFTVEDVATALEQGNVLLIVLSAEMLDIAGGQSKLAKLLTRLRGPEDRRRAPRPARVLLLGDSAAARVKIGPQPDDLGDLCASGRPEGGEEGAGACALATCVEQALTVSPESERRREIVEEAWLRFTDGKTIGPEEVAGARVSYLADYLRARSDVLPIRPIDVKMHAYAAANRSNMSCFDPTSGFDALIDESDPGREVRNRPLDDLGPCADIALHWRELSDALRSLQLDTLLAKGNGGTKNARRAVSFLRLFSTGVHWLSGRSLERIYKLQQPLRKVEDPHRDIGGLFLQRLGLEIEEPGPTSPEDQGGPPRDPSRRYHLSFAMKALVQDQWRALDPAVRSDVHHAVARYLWENQHDKKLLADELPFVPNRGRHRLHFLVETIRHLVRSVECMERCNWEDEVPVVDVPEADRAHFVLAPRALGAKAGPQAAVAYCFDVLFREELQGGQDIGRGNLMNRRYGAFGVSVEVLQLLSRDGVTGRPRPELPRRLRAAFLRECGAALLEHGRLDEAERCFRREDGLEEGFSIIETRDNELDLAVLLAIRGRVAEGEKIVVAVRQAIQDDLSRAPQGDAAMALRMSYRRARFREAYMRYLARDPFQAFSIIYGYVRAIDDDDHFSQLVTAELRKTLDAIAARGDAEEAAAALRPTLLAGPSRPSVDTMFVLISALRRFVQEPETLPSGIDGSEGELRPIKILEAASSLATEERERAGMAGHAHAAMGMKILLARLWMDVHSIEMAQRHLVSVQNELLTYGGSERTFLGFLCDAGAVLMHPLKNEPARAYVTYLRPCLLRAHARGYDREMRRAGAACLGALKKMRDSLTSTPDLFEKDLKKAQVEATRMAERIERLRRRGTVGREAYARDAFAYNNAPENLEKCGDLAYLERERSMVSALLEGNVAP